MDWSKAKTVFIYIFTFLNIFLLINIGISKMSYGVSAETVSNAERILEDRGVKLKCKIPTANTTGYALIFDNTEIDRIKVISNLLGSVYISDERIKDEVPLVNGSKKLTFKDEGAFIYEDSKPVENVDVTSAAAVEKYLKKYIERFGIPVTKLERDSAILNSRDGSVSITLIERYQGILVFDNRIEANITGNGITYLKCKYKNVKGMEPRERNLTPAYQVLLRNFTRNRNVTIKGIDSGFMMVTKPESNTREFFVYSVWRVRAEDGSDRYFNSDGEEIHDLKM